MIDTTKLTGARVFSKALARLLPVLAMIAVLGGCGALSGPPDAAGVWEGEVVFPSEGTLMLALDLQQSESGGLSGTMRYLEKGASPDEVRSMPVSGGSVNEAGEVQVVAQESGGLDTTTLNVSGAVEGDVMDARFDAGGPTLPYRAERIGEAEYQARMEERRQAYERQVADEEEALDQQNEVRDRYNELAEEAGDQASGIERRLVVIAGGYDDGPAGQLGDALGPEDPGADLYACSQGGVSCEVAELEERLENDTQDVAEAEGDDYAPSACDTVDFDYYTNYDFSEESGAEYAQTRDDLRAASDGLEEDAEAALGSARRAEAAADDLEDAGGGSSSLTYSSDEVETMSSEAGEAERTTEDALAAADERYAGYEERADAVVREGLALRDQAGC